MFAFGEPAGGSKPTHFWIRTAVRCIVIVSLMGTVACDRDSGGGIEGGRSKAPEELTESALAEVIKEGMSLAELTDMFGPPTTSNDLGKDMSLVTWHYPNTQKRGFYMAGFSARVSAGHIVTWSPIWGQTDRFGGGQDSQGQFGEQLFKLYVADDRFDELLRRLDRGETPSMIGSNLAPDLELKAKIFSGISGEETPPARTVILVLERGDTDALAKLVAMHVGTRLMITCRDTVIAGPEITRATGTSRQLLFTVRDAKVLEVFQDQQPP